MTAAAAHPGIVHARRRICGHHCPAQCAAFLAGQIAHESAAESCPDGRWPAVPPSGPRPASAHGPQFASAVLSTDPAVWGPVRWAELHSYALGCPESCQPVARILGWLEMFARSLPCGECRRHWREITAAHPPDLRDRATFFAWTVARHNDVSRRLGKKEITPPQALAFQAPCTPAANPPHPSR